MRTPKQDSPDHKAPYQPTLPSTPQPEANPPRPKAGPAAPPALAPGQEIGGYVLEACIGKGGMGEVWRGIQPQIKRQVAIKVLDPRLAGDSNLVVRFLREAQAVNEVRHPNLVDIFAFGEVPGQRRPYLVMEYLEGRPLTSLLRERGGLPLREIEPLLVQLCNALGAAHAKGIIHRDLKPDNIFLVEQAGQPILLKLLDFGIAKVSEGVQLTQTGEVFGTPEYMSPEQCLGTKQTDARSDLYSLGIIVYEMISGQTPFAAPGEKRGNIWMKHVTAPVPPIASVAPRALPPGIEGFLQKALTKEPAGRYQTAADFLAGFRGALSGQVPAARADQPERAIVFAPGQGADTIPGHAPEFARPTKLIGRSASGSPLRLALVGFVGALGLVGLVWWMLPASPRDTPSAIVPPAPVPPAPPSPAPTTAPGGAPELLLPAASSAPSSAPHPESAPAPAEKKARPKETKPPAASPQPSPTPAKPRDRDATVDPWSN